MNEVKEVKLLLSNMERCKVYEKAFKLYQNIDEEDVYRYNVGLCSVINNALRELGYTEDVGLFKATRRDLNPYNHMEQFPEIKRHEVENNGKHYWFPTSEAGIRDKILLDAIAELKPILSKKERGKVYEKAFELYQNTEFGNGKRVFRGQLGLCSVIKEALDELGYTEYNVYMNMMVTRHDLNPYDHMEQFPEIERFKPRVRIGGYWFPDKSVEIRDRILLSAINDCDTYELEGKFVPDYYIDWLDYGTVKIMFHELCEAVVYNVNDGDLYYQELLEDQEGAMYFRAYHEGEERGIIYLETCNEYYWNEDNESND